MTHKYEITIYWSNEDEAYIAEVPELPGCMTHGDTHAAALANANEAIQLWLETAKEFGDEIPAQKGRRSTARTSELRSKRRDRFERLSNERRNNPRTTFSAGRAQPRMNPKSH
jgi:predicted RNase H-like HicB family nuclease